MYSVERKGRMNTEFGEIGCGGKGLNRRTKDEASLEPDRFLSWREGHAVTLTRTDKASCSNRITLHHVNKIQSPAFRQIHSNLGCDPHRGKSLQARALCSESTHLLRKRGKHRNLLPLREKDG
jgi:hypothetical protein